MNSEFFQRYKAGFILFVFSFFSLICLTNRIDPYVRGIKYSIWFIVSPEVVYSGSFFNKIDSIRGRIFKLIQSEGENVILREQIQSLARRELERDTLQEENSRLRELLDLRDRVFSKAVAAEVVGRDVRDWFHSVVINKGLENGVQYSAAVVGGLTKRPALIGRITEVENNTSKVLLITDPVSAVSVGVESTGDIGLLEGRNQPTVLIRYLPNFSAVKSGDIINTVGLGGVFPPGIPVGRVYEVRTTPDGFFKEAEVIPFFDFRSLRSILVLARTEKEEATLEGGKK